jgi:photosystem II stability/assembly factor-like uncharacterized protein
MRYYVLYSLLLLSSISLNAQWKQAFKLGDTQVYNLVKADNVLLMRDGSYIWKSSDDGQAWDKTIYAVPEGNAYTGKETFETDGKNLFVLYTSDDYDAVYYSADLGETWNCTLKTEKFSYNRLVVIEGKAYLTTYKKGYYTSTDGGVTWQNHPAILIDGKPLRPQFRHLVKINGKTFATQYQTGIVVSTDGEKTFKTIPALKESNQFTLHRVGNYLIAGNSKYIANLKEWKSGIWTSSDGGTTWSGFNFSLEPNGQLNDVINAVEKNGIVYMSKGGIVFRSADGCRTWENTMKGCSWNASVIQLLGNSLIASTWQYVYELGIE